MWLHRLISIFYVRKCQLVPYIGHKQFQTRPFIGFITLGNGLSYFNKKFIDDIQEVVAGTDITKKFFSTVAIQIGITAMCHIF